MNIYRLSIFCGDKKHNRFKRALNYDHACKLFGVGGFPPAYIWTIERDIELSIRLGRNGFKNGINAPCHDQELMELISNGCDAITVLNAWTKAWHSENLSL